MSVKVAENGLSDFMTPDRLLLKALGLDCEEEGRVSEWMNRKAEG